MELNKVHSRRKFIQKTGALLACSAIFPTIIINKSYARTSGIVIGHGSHRYEVIERWGLLDSGKNPVNDCHEMVEDAEGRLLMLTNDTRNNILIYDKSGKLLDSWGTSYPGGHGLTISNEGKEQFLFITDTERNQVIKTDLKGKEILKFEYPKETGVYDYPDQFVPTETAVNPENGDVYIADGYGLNYIIQYNSKGQYIRHFGGRGSADEKFDCCHGIIIDKRNKRNPSLIITDRSHMALKRFSLDGKYISTLPVPGSFICRPVIKGNNLYAAVYRSTSQDYANSGYITIFDEKDKVISTPGGTEPIYMNNVLQEQRKDRSFMGFLHPHDVCIDSDESIYVPQWNSGKSYPVKLVRV
jgi:DNA-binding beta-propeller fold protein YncE